jgi:hypothetical protein
MLFILGGLAAAQTSTLPELRTAAATITPAIYCAISGNFPLTHTAAAYLELLERKKAWRM